MKFSIESIVLWPRLQQFKPRVVPFEPGVLNVISGSSRTGKSAIIPIIDYCLGSDKCTIPVGVIRDACSWFGIVIRTAEGQKLLARREPGSQRFTGDMYVADGITVSIPEAAPEKNANVDFVKSQLDDIAGLTSLDFETGNTGFKGRPGFRDLMAFCFQPQNVVANPNTLFYKADSYEHREKLRVLFPYVLGAITAETLAKRHELDELKRTHRRKKLELETVRHVSERFLAQMQSHLSTLREFGLIGETEGVAADQYAGISILRAAIARNKESIGAATTVGTIGISADELAELRAREADQSTQLAVLRQRYLEMSELRKSSIDYRGSLIAQRDRLNISKWLRAKHHDEHDCPVCGNAMNQHEERLDALLLHLEEIEGTASHFQTVPASLDREYQRVRSEMEGLTEKLTATQFRLRELRELSENASKRQYTELGISRFMGRMEADLRVLESVGEDSSLQDEVDLLERRIRALEEEVNPQAIRERTNRALSKFSGYAARILPNLDVENAQDSIKLSISDLTVKVERLDREDFLWEVGSGSNWLSYHLATSVALQEMFGELSESPVPQFVIYDQPSQVYFPQQLTARVVDREAEQENSDPSFDKDEDVEAVAKVFSVLSAAAQRSEGKLQFIVLDHAPERVWVGTQGVHLVEEWRGGLKLVPMEWLGGATQA